MTLDVYHAVPGKAPALESRFRDASKLQAKHGLNVVGYWVPTDDDPAWANTFIYLIAHSSQKEAENNWDAFHADLAFQELRRSENECQQADRKSGRNVHAPDRLLCDEVAPEFGDLDRHSVEYKGIRDSH